MVKGMQWFDWALLVLIVVGGINWGLVGAFDFNLVELITFGVKWLARVIYVTVGIASIVSIIRLVAISL